MKTYDELFAWGSRDLSGLVNYCLSIQEQCHSLAQTLAQNSRNSSKPPSSDKKTGGQPGHAGYTLKPVDKPDHTNLIPVTLCPCGCGADLSRQPVIRLERRQVFDLPVQKLEVTEHITEVKLCPTSGNEVQSPWPEGVNAPVLYGARFLAWLAYLSVQQLLPVERIGQLCADLFGQRVSDATVQAAVQGTLEAIAPFQDAVVEHIRQAPVANTDESGVRVNKKLHWLHVISTKFVTWYGVHAKRGRDAIEAFGFLFAYRGILVHDCWAPYLDLLCEHSLCNGHILRELTFVQEELHQPWAKDFHQLLLNMNLDVEEHKSRNVNLTQTELSLWHHRYRALLRKGRLANPPPALTSSPKKRGRKKQTKTQNLLDRLEKYEMWVLAFLHDFRIPFTNNLAEQDIRMIKVKQKISGSFRTLRGAESFLAIRSYISTVRKNGLQIFPAIVSALTGKPFIPSVNSK
jgi:transposase